MCLFGYAHIRIEININEIVRFTKWNQLYAIFGRSQVKVVFFMEKLFSFYVILCLRGASRNITLVYK